MKVWVFRQVKNGKTLELTPKGIKGMEELEAELIPGWEKPYEARELTGRLGLGCLPKIHDPSGVFILLIQRDLEAPREPLAVDLPSGIGSATSLEILEKRKEPIIPSLATFSAELAGEILIGYGGIRYLPIPGNINNFLLDGNPEVIKRYCATTAYTANKILNKKAKIFVEMEYEIRKPPQSYRVIEKGFDGRERMELPAFIAYEPPRKSTEIIAHTWIDIDKELKFADGGLLGYKIRGIRPEFADGEYVPNMEDTRDGGLIAQEKFCLNRFVLKLYPSGELELWRGFELIGTFSSITDYAEARIHKPLSGKGRKKLEEAGLEPPISLRQALERGLTSGATSKIYAIASQFKPIQEWIKTIEEYKHA